MYTVKFLKNYNIFLHTAFFFSTWLEWGNGYCYIYFLEKKVISWPFNR
ncbi:hypothetical protein SAMN04487896_1824 [Paenibacillus sp. ov031]|nr:hypothetical protein SAMN04487896_1824 [Paenibacillus sp. ov031]